MAADCLTAFLFPSPPKATPPPPEPLVSSFMAKSVFRSRICMRDRSKNRKPLQKGRNLSIEGIHAVQALRLSKKDESALTRAFQSKFRRLIKRDMIAVLRELQRQDECQLARMVFNDVQKENWYKPQVSLYADMVALYGRNGMLEDVEHLLSEIKASVIDSDLKEFNIILATLLDCKMFSTAMEFHRFMKQIGCEPDESTFKILINGLDANDEMCLSAVIRKEAETEFGSPLEFLDDAE